MGGHDLTATTAETYRAFALEAAGRSPQYERLSTEVADDDAILSFLASLPPAKRQPNLLFAAARSLLGAPPEPESLRSLVADGGRSLLSSCAPGARRRMSPPAVPLCSRCWPWAPSVVPPST